MTNQTSDQLITIFGYGPTGQTTAELLLARGMKVRVVQRRRPEGLPAVAEFMACDVLDAGQARAAMEGAAQAVVTVGFEYKGEVWKRDWPKATANLLAAAEASGARVVHIDNMYMYGPQARSHTAAAISEETPLTSYGRKPAARAEVTRMWMKAGREGRVRWAALRAPDFYGPGVKLSHLGETGLQAIAAGKSATLLMAPDLPHAFAYVPDIARAALSLLEAGDEDFNQAWHVPCAPARTPRELLQMGADAAGRKLKMTAMPTWMLLALGTVMPMLREFAEMRFTWNRPYHVDASKFARRFWADATPFEVGIAQTMRAERAATAKQGASRAAAPSAIAG
jgi:nucleoside-diphosphate-sugar epimerase